MPSPPRGPLPNAALLRRSAVSMLRYVGVMFLALSAFGLVLLAAGKDPWRAYLDTFRYTLANAYGFSEVLVRMIPLLLTAAAVALPSRVGLINIGGEGQLQLGAWMATWGALYLHPFLPPALLIPTMVVLGMIGGGGWAALAGFLRARGWVNETIATVLLNYVAPLIVGFFVFGPWRSPEQSFYPQSPDFVPAARLMTFGNTRVHLGLVFALVALVSYWFLLNKTKWGLEMRAIGGNPEAARRLGIRVERYMVVAMFMGGALAGLAGMAEVSAIHGRLRTGFSPGYGFVGFLTSWMAAGNPIGILVTAFLLAVITSAGDVLQISQGLPYAVVNILLAIILFVVLARPPLPRRLR